MKNIGNGIALDVTITLKALLSYNETVGRDASEEQIQEYIAENGQAQFWMVDGVRQVVVTERATQSFEATHTASAIEPTGFRDFAAPEIAEKAYNSPSLDYETAEARYIDMFGNKYRTIYQDEDLKKYAWEQPANLQTS